MCIDYDDYDEVFYYIKIFDEKSSDHFNPIQPQIFGSSLEYILKEGVTQVFYSTLAYNNMLSYEIRSNGRSILEVSYYECDSFPFCIINEKEIKNATKIKRFNSFSDFSLNNEMLKNKSAISQKQYLISVTCKNGTRNGLCGISNYVYSNNNRVLLERINSNRYLLKNSQNLVKVSRTRNNDIKTFDVSVIIYSGN